MNTVQGVDNSFWEKNAQWWQDGFTEGEDPEYAEQIVPMAQEWLEEFEHVLDVGTGEGQIARRLAAQGSSVVGIDPTKNQLATALVRGGGPRYVRGAAQTLPFADDSFDAVLACLVFEHMPDHRPAIAEVARVLRPGGRFVFFLNHPFIQCPNSGWIDDHILEEQYWRIGPYLLEDVMMEELAPGIFLPFVHRPLSQYVNAMGENGLWVRRMEEPVPPASFIEKADEYAEAVTIHRLLMMVAELMG